MSTNLKIPYDLHSHSHYSDGLLSPEALVKVVAKEGISTLALCDHDTVAGLPEAMNTAKNENIRVIPAVEISAQWENHEIHIVALNINPEDAALRERLEKQQEKRLRRAAQIGDALTKIGIQGAYEAVVKATPQGLITRPHFARFLVAGGHAADPKKAFLRYLKRGKPGYVAVKWEPMKEVISWIQNAGGFAILAHPTRYKLTFTQLRHLLNAFKVAQGHGIEVLTPHQQPKDIQALAQFCSQYSLYASVGSDYHGPLEYRWGRYMDDLPQMCVPIWSQF